MKTVALAALAALAMTLAASAQNGGAAPKAQASKPAEAAAQAAPDRSAEVVAALKAWDEKLVSLKASFTQQVEFREAGLKQAIEGKLSYVRPNLLRIDHSKPASQVIVTDKSDIWIYKPADKQAEKTSWNSWRGTQEQNFSGILDFGNYASLAEKNKIAVTEGEKGAPLTVIFTPRSGAGYSLKLRLAAEDLFPLEAELTVEGVVISTKLGAVEKNAALDKELFKFSPPSGTEILKL